jgi:hypothetical protein
MSSAATTSFSNAIITTSRAHRSTGPFRIQFGSDWRDNGIIDWYRSLGPRHTKINTFQLRREKLNALKHQYVVLILSGDSGDSILRLDRGVAETNPNPMDAVKSHGTEPIDTIEDVDSLSNLDKSSYCLAELHCQENDVDLSDIIKICFGIHRDDKAGRYTLQRFNCYFFSWTMLVVIARHAKPWDMDPFHSAWETLSQTLADALSTKFADTIIHMLVDGGVAITMGIYLKLKRRLSRVVVSRRARIAWVMPQWLIRLTLREMIRSSWRPEMHTFLRFRLRSVLLSALQPTLQSVLTDFRDSTLRTTLWKDDVGNAIRDVARHAVIASLLNAGTTALSGIRLTMNEAAAFQSLAVTFGVDRDFLEARRGAALIAGFNAIMQATPLFAAHGPDGFVTDDAEWDEVWNSIRDTTREAVEGVMKNVEERRWAGLWDTLMEEWVAGWEVIRPKMRETARKTVGEMTDLVSDALAYSVVETLPDTHLHIGLRHMVSSPNLG